MKVRIIIATHKKYRMPNDKMYMPVQVGAAGKESLGYSTDNTGDNISELNPFFCELTGLYWGWKNLDEDYMGLVHYRRHFSLEYNKKDLWDSILTSQQLLPYLGKVKVFVPNKRKYYIETLYSHYAHTHYAYQLDSTRQIIKDLHPGFLNSFDSVIKQRYGYMFNMFIMEKALLSEYCSWLFSILFELRNRIGEEQEKELSAYQARFYGRVSEILFNVWLDKKLVDKELNKEHIKELRSIHMEKINWFKKGMSFLRAKFLGRRYSGSF